MRLHALAAPTLPKRPGRFQFEHGIEAAKKLMNVANPPTAIFAANDDSAAGVMAGLAQMGLKVPDDVSVAGFDDSWVAQSVWPYLTTIHQPIAEMAQTAAEMLIDRNGATVAKPAKPDSIIILSSAARPRPEACLHEGLVPLLPRSRCWPHRYARSTAWSFSLISAMNPMTRCRWCGCCSIRTRSTSKALVATTSTWQKAKISPEIIRQVVAAYGKVQPNLMLHAKGWPTQAELEARISSGQPGYGMAATGDGKLSDGAKALIAAADKADSRPLWVSLWGGANTLAQALMHVQATRLPEALAALLPSCGSIQSPIRMMPGRGSGASFPSSSTSSNRRRPTALNMPARPGPGFRVTAFTATARARISPPSAMNGSTRTSAAKARWAKPIPNICSSWKAIRLPFWT